MPLLRMAWIRICSLPFFDFNPLLVVGSVRRDVRALREGEMSTDLFLFWRVGDVAITGTAVAGRDRTPLGARLGAFVTKNKTVYDAAMKFAQARLSPP